MADVKFKPDVDFIIPDNVLEYARQELVRRDKQIKRKDIQAFCQHGKEQVCNDKHLRKANKEYVCEDCSNLIHSGSFYYALLATMGIGKRNKPWNMKVGQVCINCAVKRGCVILKTDVQ